jgi:hypothetical protein
MVQIWIAIALLAGFVAALKFGLNQALEAWGFGPYMAICIVGTALVIAAAFAYDRAEARSRRSQMRELNDRPPSMK